MLCMRSFGTTGQVARCKPSQLCCGKHLTMRECRLQFGFSKHDGIYESDKSLG